MQECEWLPTVKTGLHSHRVTSPGSNLLDTMFKILNLTSGENVRMWPSNPRGPSSKDSLATRWKWEKGQRRRIYPSRQIPNYHAMFNCKVLWDTFLKLKLSNECIHLKNHLTAINLCSKHWDHKVSKGLEIGGQSGQQTDWGRSRIHQSVNSWQVPTVCQALQVQWWPGQKSPCSKSIYSPEW